ncbi:hypothetical protein I203_103360 [Kwoniella mangroviensis CBS 8507]|uniref:uncharacterized protein n=1 Tax=Kwoniella mangroviensis CBS 8507 TaxID=1296122 RepID=UPI00080CEDBD|nr:uncharacterized protein I203_06066 [Kwoniella mangroviensis CBS 8507]OCF64822.1 hypothetical protein I203_06066 [Kwoniella mangroviensis CBS 8507]
MSENILDDASDLFQYGGDTWGVDHKDDPFTPQYQEGTFHTTTVHMAWSRVCWEGTGIKIHGAKRANHGFYAVSIDNAEPELLDGYSKKEQIKAELYVADGLEWGQHQLTIWNVNKFNFIKNHIWLDVDFATIDGNAISCDGLPEITAVPQDPGNSTSSVSITATDSCTFSNSTISAFTVDPTTTVTNTVGLTTTLSSGVSPTTTVQLSFTAASSASNSLASNSNSTAPSASSTGASSGAQRLVAPGIEGQIAFAGMIGYYLFRTFM